MSSNQEMFGSIIDDSQSFYDFIQEKDNNLNDSTLGIDDEIDMLNYNFENNELVSSVESDFLNILTGQENFDFSFDNNEFSNNYKNNKRDIGTVNHSDVSTLNQKYDSLSHNVLELTKNKNMDPSIHLDDILSENVFQKNILSNSRNEAASERQQSTNLIKKRLNDNHVKQRSNKRQKNKHFEKVDLNLSDDGEVLVFDSDEFETAVLFLDDPVYNVQYFRNLSAQIEKKQKLKKERTFSGSTLFSPKNNNYCIAEDKAAVTKSTRSSVEPFESISNINAVGPRSNSTSVEPFEQPLSISDILLGSNNYNVELFDPKVNESELFMGIPEDDSFRNNQKNELSMIIQGSDSFIGTTRVASETKEKFSNTFSFTPKNIALSKNNPFSSIRISTTKSYKNQKRERPPVIIDNNYYKRNRNYWNVIINNSFYKNLVAQFKHVIEKNKITLLSSFSEVNFAMSAIQPNYAKLEFFEKFQNIDGWVYSWNPKCKNPTPALRWCGQPLNFYEYSIIRRKPNVPKSTEGLCPFCPLSDGMNLDTVFRNLDKSSYLHHVTLNHGVFSSGYEIYPPILGTINNSHVAICTHCSECVDISISKENETFLTPYFRHCIDNHNKGKKRERTEEEKVADKMFFATDKNKLLYEKQYV